MAAQSQASRFIERREDRSASVGERTGSETNKVDKTPDDGCRSSSFKMYGSMDRSFIGSLDSHPVGHTEIGPTTSAKGTRPDSRLSRRCSVYSEKMNNSRQEKRPMVDIGRFVRI